MRVYLLRHGEVASHQGDVPITAEAEEEAFRVGRHFGGEVGPVRVLTGETRRAKVTGTHFSRGLGSAGVEVIGPDVAHALRNPDLYVGGVRVNMVSDAPALAEQVAGLSPGDVPAIGFFTEFFASSDRIGWWLTHPTPPGEKADAVAGRMRSFLISLQDPVPTRTEAVVAITHSPLLRSVALDLLGADIGEPPWVSGLLVTVGDDLQLSAEIYVGAKT